MDDRLLETWNKVRELARRYEISFLWAGNPHNPEPKIEVPITLYRTSLETSEGMTIRILKGRDARRGPAESS